ncbi:hypothetical protein ACS0X5_25015 [Burkholderia gladioli]|uniref:hypothetical protein n=1 Tax=Burkholderia gladioli TaxID=28095 RepID=UPI00163E502C|nr:hypothetical protein [Burkholderia gladioli]
MKVLTAEQAKNLQGGGPISSLGSMISSSTSLWNGLAQFTPSLGSYLQDPKNFNNKGK